MGRGCEKLGSESRVTDGQGVDCIYDPWKIAGELCTIRIKGLVKLL
jgi:hypothetical protein